MRILRGVKGSRSSSVGANLDLMMRSVVWCTTGVRSNQRFFSFLPSNLVSLSLGPVIPAVEYVIQGMSAILR